MTRRIASFLASFFVLPAAALGCTSERALVHTDDPVVVVQERSGRARMFVLSRRPPPARREVRPRRPSRRHVWIGGRWSWRSGGYTWVRGRWVMPPRHGARWIAGRWTRHTGGWVYVAGRWRF